MMQRLNWQRGVAGRMYVKVEWLNMGYLADFDTSFTYVKTFSIVSDKMVSFKNLTFLLVEKLCVGSSRTNI